MENKEDAAIIEIIKILRYKHMMGLAETMKMAEDDKYILRLRDNNGKTTFKKVLFRGLWLLFLEKHK